MSEIYTQDAIGYPGSKNGPCASDCAAHINCIAKIRNAEMVCPECSNKIGYGSAWVMVSEIDDEPIYIHLKCHKVKTKREDWAARILAKDKTIWAVDLNDLSSASTYHLVQAISAEWIMSLFADWMNYMRNSAKVGKELADTLIHKHRTIQQSVLAAIFYMIIEIAKTRGEFTDERNEASYKICKKIANLIGDKPQIPFI